MSNGKPECGDGSCDIDGCAGCGGCDCPECTSDDCGSGEEKEHEDGDEA